jgi:hypothetical protein
MNIARVNIGVLTGWKKIKQRRISFVLGYLRMIFQLQLHRILATFNIKKKSDSLYIELLQIFIFELVQYTFYQ